MLISGLKIIPFICQQISAIKSLEGLWERKTRSDDKRGKWGRWIEIIVKKKKKRGRRNKEKTTIVVKLLPDMKCRKGYISCNVKDCAHSLYVM